MEKIIYTLVRGDGISVYELGQALVARGARRVTAAVNDADVAAASALRIANSDPAPDSAIGVWVDTVNDRCELESAVGKFGTIVGGYLVTESTPLETSQSAMVGERTAGMMQIALLRIPSGMDKSEWFRIWRDDHTQVAIDTQSTFVYRQNLVVRSLLPDAPEVAGIVEEAFPPEAMTSQHAFYAAVGDDEKLKRHQAAMWKSSKRFIDLVTIDVLPTSEYVWT